LEHAEREREMSEVGKILRVFAPGFLTRYIMMLLYTRHSTRFPYNIQIL
jgi:hypothetical protein